MMYVPRYSVLEFGAYSTIHTGDSTYHEKTQSIQRMYVYVFRFYMSKICNRSLKQNFHLKLFERLERHNSRLKSTVAIKMDGSS